MSETTAEPLDTWAVLELLGHRTLAGKLSETVIAGRPVIRIDVITGDGKPVVTQYYGPESVYGLTPCTREQAERLARKHWTVGLPTAYAELTAGSDVDDEPDGDPWAGDPLGDLEDDEDDSAAEELAREGMETAMSASEREEYDRDAEFRLDAADEARDLEREADGDDEEGAPW